VRCAKCGNENPDSNRFCGMCGTALARPAPARVAVEAARTPASLGEVRGSWPTTVPSRPTREAPHAVPVETNESAEPRRMRDDSPTITGPSFLGLNKPAPGTGTGDGLGRRDGPHTSSGDLSYLLEDDEEEPKRGWGKIIAIVVVLALAAGFGYWYWQQGGFDRLIASMKQPAAQAPDSGTNTAPAASGGAPAANTAPPSSTDNAASQPAANGAATTPAASSSLNAPAATGSQNSSGAPDATSAAPTDAPPTPASNTAPSQPPAADATASTKKHSPPSTEPDSDEESPADEDSTEAPKPAAKAPLAKPPAAKPVDAVAEAQRYIYGRGVHQDCDHGLRLLKSAQSNPTAMISLGALYSTGTCTPRDLPTAYRWFALALHKQPENQALQDDLQKLWSQMTQPERQLAIKLSQ